MIPFDYSQLWILLPTIFSIVQPAGSSTGHGLSESPMSFSLFPETECQGSPVVDYSGEPTSLDPLVLFPRDSSSRDTTITVKSATIRRAESSSVIALYENYGDPKPAVTISFAIDIHDTVQIPAFDQVPPKSNVHVWTGKDITEFRKVAIIHPTPQFYIL